MECATLDLVVCNPDHYKTIFENDHVRVHEYPHEPGDRTTPHDRLADYGTLGDDVAEGAGGPAVGHADRDRGPAGLVGGGCSRPCSASHRRQFGRPSRW